VTIPISKKVQVLPGVVPGGGAVSSQNGLVVTQDPSVAPGQILDLTSALAVSNWFGPNAPETLLANNYFPGIVNGGQLPYDLKFVGYATAATPAGVFGVSTANLTLSALQSLSGTLIVTTAALHTSTTISLAAATSFANAATIMLAAFTAPDFTIAYDAQRQRFTLTTTATGPTATSSPVTGTLATAVGLSAGVGAFNQAAGVNADTPASVMNRAVGFSTNWMTFTTAYAAVIADRLAYAAWNSGQNFQYAYIAWDNEAASIVPNNAVSFGAQVFAQPYQGTAPLYGTGATAGAAMGWAASINFGVQNGRTNFDSRQFVAGTPATVTDRPTSDALDSNHYSYIGAFANAANNFTTAVNGYLSGSFLWLDTYVDQIYLNRQIQLALYNALLAYNSIPYNQDGYTELYRAVADVANQGVVSGIIRQGVTLSQSQAQQVDATAGRTISTTLQTQGWYCLFGDPANVAQARQNRTSPSAIFFYTDGGSIQSIIINSTAVI
jgi:Protein of unknown function (DUF3383)